MSKMEIAKRIANVHNILTQIMVNGDNAIAMGKSLVDLRNIVSDLQDDIQADEKDNSEKQNCEIK